MSTPTTRRRASLARQLHVSDARHAPAVDVDHLMIDHVAREPQLVRLLRRFACRPCPERDLGCPRRSRPPSQGIAGAGACLRDDQRGHAREGLVQANGQIAHAADPLAARVDHVLAQVVGQREHRRRASARRAAASASWAPHARARSSSPGASGPSASSTKKLSGSPTSS